LVKRQLRVKVRGKWHTVEVDEPQQYPFQVTVDGETLDVEVEVGASQDAPAPVRRTESETPGGVGHPTIVEEDLKILRSPLPGRIVSVSVNVWDQVTPGVEVCVLESMKMEQSIHMSQTGLVRAVFVKAGDNVAVSDPLIQLE
jgi:biotin carboxyl carrier protein